MLSFSSFCQFVTQRDQMRRMSANTNLIYLNRCATRSNFYKFVIMHSDDLWYLICQTHHLVFKNCTAKLYFDILVLYFCHWFVNKLKLLLVHNLKNWISCISTFEIWITLNYGMEHGITLILVLKCFLIHVK